MKYKISLFAMCVLLLGFNIAFSHGGGLNSSGCHNNRKTGGYHCHRSSYTPSEPLEKTSIPTLEYKPLPIYKYNHSLPIYNQPSASSCSAYLSRIDDLKREISQLKDSIQEINTKHEKELVALQKLHDIELSRNKASYSEEKQHKVFFTPDSIEAKKTKVNSSRKSRNKSIAVGMHRIQVRKIEGAPYKVGKTSTETVWYYKKKIIYFSSKNNKVIRTVLKGSNLGRNKNVKSIRGSIKLTMEALSSEERGSIRSACIMDYSKGVATYRRCTNRQLFLLSNSVRMPSLEHLSYDERGSIKASCILDYGKGPAIYNSCIVKQLKDLERVKKY